MGSKTHLSGRGRTFFRMDAAQEGARLKAICTSHGLVGLSLWMMRAAARPSSIITASWLSAPVTQWSPISPRSVARTWTPAPPWKIGYAVALDKPVFGWSSRTDELHRRIQHRHMQADELRIDEGQYIVEDFGLAENLMIAESLLSLTPLRKPPSPLRRTP